MTFILLSLFYFLIKVHIYSTLFIYLFASKSCDYFASFYGARIFSCRCSFIVRWFQWTSIMFGSFGWTVSYGRTLQWWCRSLCWSNWTSFSSFVWLCDRNLLNNHLLLESWQYIFPINLVNFTWCILINEIINMHKTTTNSAENLTSFFTLDINTFWSKLIYTLWFSNE